MRDMLRTQEGMNICLEQRDEELQQLQSQSQVDGAQLAALSLQMQELISLVESRAEVVGKDLLNWRPITSPTGHRLSLISEPSIRPIKPIDRINQ